MSFGTKVNSIVQLFNSTIMKQISKTLVILGLMLSIINLSCEKSIAPNEKNENINEQEKFTC